MQISCFAHTAAFSVLDLPWLSTEEWRALFYFIYWTVHLLYCHIVEVLNYGVLKSARYFPFRHTWNEKKKSKILICSFFFFPLHVGSLLYAERPSETHSKDAYNSADSAPSQVKLPAWGTTSARENHTKHQLLPTTNLQHPKPPEVTSLSSDKKKRTKRSLENSTGLRKHLLQYGGALHLESAAEGPSPASFDFSYTNRMPTDRRLAEAANSVSARFHHASSYQKIIALAEAHPFLHCGTVESGDPNMPDHFNRPGKTNPYRSADPWKKIIEPSWVTNRQSSSLPDHFSLLKKGKRANYSGKEHRELSTGWVA